jgi:hypothetical protein
MEISTLLIEKPFVILFIGWCLFCALLVFRDIFNKQGFQSKASSYQQRQQPQFINNYQFSDALLNKFSKKYPSFNNKQKQLVIQGLKDYFYLCNQSPKQTVSMPSQVVDDLWHEFILFTKDYQDFCHQAFNKFLHHIPTEAMTNQKQAQNGIKRAWYLGCLKDNINPRQPKKLPLIFAIDSLLEIENGFYYDLNCHNSKKANKFPHCSSNSYCVTNIGCISGCAGISSHNATSHHSSDHSGDSGHDNGHHSCSGSSCSGGCGGGCGDD